MVLTLDDVHPELRAATARMAALRMPPRPVVRALTRVMPVPRLERVEVRTVHGGRVGLRIFTPVTRRGDGALLWVHGGGLVIGSARQDDRLCGSTADRLGVPIVSVDYRLAPEHPCPAALDDVRAGWRWLQRRAGLLGVDPARVAVGGESAGAGLAAALAQRLLDEGGVQPVAQWLFAPMIDDRTAARRELDDEGWFVWDNRSNRDGWRAYLGREPGVREPPQYAAAARRADLTGLPPAHVVWGDIELFAAEDAAYAERLRAAGVPVTTEVVPGAPHGFENWAWAAPVARAVVGRAQDRLAELLAIG